MRKAFDDMATNFKTIDSDYIRLTETNVDNFNSINITFRENNDNISNILSKYFNDKRETIGDIYYYRNSINIMINELKKIDIDRLLNDEFYNKLNMIMSDKYCGTCIITDVRIITDSYIFNQDIEREKDNTHLYKFKCAYLFDKYIISFAWSSSHIKNIFMLYNAISNYAHRYKLVYITAQSNNKEIIKLSGEKIEFPVMFKTFDSYSLMTAYYKSSIRKFTYIDKKENRQIEDHGIIAYPSENYCNYVENYKWIVNHYYDIIYDEAVKDYYFYILEILYNNKYITEDEFYNIKMYINVIE
jgi:hypothetical protein